MLDYGEFPDVSKNCRCCVVGSQSLKSSHGNSRVKYFKEFEMNKKMNISLNYYLNVSLISSSIKNDRCQDVTVLEEKRLFKKKCLNNRILCISEILKMNNMYKQFKLLFIKIFLMYPSFSIQGQSVNTLN